MRLLASLGHYVATRDAAGLQIHQYGAARIATPLATGPTVALRMEARYPWEGHIRLTVEETGPDPWTLALRVPGWAAGAGARVNGDPAGVPAASGYAQLRRAWARGDVVEVDLPITPRLVEAHPWIESTHGRVAIERGPLVYCIEAIDHPGARIADLELDPAAPLTAGWQPDRLDGVAVVQASGCAVDTSAWARQLYRPVGSAPPASRRPVALRAIPYYAWANRGPGAMRVWIPRRPGAPAA